MNTKKLIALTFALVLVMLAVGLASCAPSTEEPAAPVATEEVAEPEPTEEVAEPEPTEEVAEPEPTEEEAEPEPEPEMPAEGPKRGGTLRTGQNMVQHYLVNLAAVSMLEELNQDAVFLGIVRLSGLSG